MDVDLCIYTRERQYTRKQNKYKEWNKVEEKESLRNGCFFIQGKK